MSRSDEQRADPLARHLAAQVMARPDRFEALKEFIVISLTAYTKMRRKMFELQPPPPELNLRYSCTEELVLFNATAKPHFIEQCAFEPMKLGNCFANAFELSMRHRELRYVEGWACMEQSIPTHHAWVEHPDGSVSDPTWLTMVREQTRPESMAPDFKARCIYMGVSIPLANHLAWFEEHGTPNLLAFGEMMPEQVLRHGMDAFKAQCPTDVLEDRIASVQRAIAERPEWKLNEDQTGYTRTWPDGEVEHWTRDDFVG